jgi:ABC-type transport system involved in multi-copper enzyme maturation permease subunit
MLARPISRGGFLLGRYFGLLAMLAANVLIMIAALAAVLRFAGYGLSATTVAAAFLILLELAILAAAALFFGSFTTPILASAFSLSVFLIGHLLSDLKAFRERGPGGLTKALTGVFYRVLPDLELFNLKSQAANGLPVPQQFVPAAALYGVTYAALFLVLAVVIFARRDLK